jgi:phosphatidylserine/phosphatidylglycerophosphate/cardiolipin synthase-like enzyme
MSAFPGRVSSRLRGPVGLVCWAMLPSFVATGLALGLTLDVWYAPEDEPLAHATEIYSHAKRYIFVSVYGLTSPMAVKALVEAKKRGLDVRVLTDRERAATDEKQQAALGALRLAGIPVRVNQHDGLMHLKQVVIDDEINLNGSMNHTTSGNRYNDERLDVIRDRAVSVKARDKFLSMWKDGGRYMDWKGRE